MPSGTALQRLAKIRYRDPLVISGKDALLVNQVSFYDNPLRFTESVNKLCDELEERGRKGVNVTDGRAKRIMLSGCPMAVPNWKIPFVVESSGAVIVAEESCIGERNTRDQISVNGGTLDGLIDAVVDRYMKIDCACFTPNEERLSHIVGMARDSRSRGVIHYSLQFCTPYLVETKKVSDACRRQGIPMLAVDTDYSAGDMEQLKTRIGAFVESL